MSNKGVDIFQYIYLVVYNNYSAFQEEFWSFFINIFIVLYSFIYSYSFMEVPGRHGVNYYMCLGVSPEVDIYDYNKVRY